MKPILFGMAMLVVLFNVGTSSAQKRIQFAKGATSATVHGLTGEYGTTYVIRARSGQKLIISLAPTKGLGIKVETNGRFGQTVLLREGSGGHYEVGLEESGDYTIFIGSTNGKSTTFTLTVATGKLAEI
jgi:hypothetical protein